MYVCMYVCMISSCHVKDFGERFCLGQLAGTLLQFLELALEKHLNLSGPALRIKHGIESTCTQPMLLLQLLEPLLPILDFCVLAHEHMCIRTPRARIAIDRGGGDVYLYWAACFGYRAFDQLCCQLGCCIDKSTSRPRSSVRYELGSVTLKRIGFFCFPIKHSTQC